MTLEVQPIQCITPTGIKVDGKETEYDLIVLSTRFRTLEFMSPIKISGHGGRRITDIWRSGARALYGVTIESLSNFAILYGLNTSMIHNSIIPMIEAQSLYINTLTGAMLQVCASGKSLRIVPTPTRVKDLNKKLQIRLNTSSLAHPNCTSWFKNEEGTITNTWSGTVVDCQSLMARFS